MVRAFAAGQAQLAVFAAAKRPSRSPASGSCSRGCSTTRTGSACPPQSPRSGADPDHRRLQPPAGAVRQGDPPGRDPHGFQLWGGTLRPRDVLGAEEPALVQGAGEAALTPEHAIVEYAEVLSQLRDALAALIEELTRRRRRSPGGSCASSRDPLQKRKRTPLRVTKVSKPRMAAGTPHPRPAPLNLDPSPPYSRAATGPLRIRRLLRATASVVLAISVFHLREFHRLHRIIPSLIGPTASIAVRA